MPDALQVRASLRALALIAACATLLSPAQAAQKKAAPEADSGPPPKVVTVTLIGHEFIQARTQTGEAIQYAITANTQFGTVEYPEGLSKFRAGNTATVVAEKTGDGWEALQVLAGDQLVYFRNPKYKRPSANAAPVRAGSLLSITPDQLVLRVAGDKDFRYVVTQKTKFGESKNRMTPAHFPPGSMAKVVAVKGKDGVPVATQVVPFIQDVGGRRQAKVRQPVPETVKPTPECRGTIVVIERGYVEIRAKSGQCFRYVITSTTLFGDKKAVTDVTQLKAGNFVKVRARVGDKGEFEATEIALADYRK
jgi:hypothetical protein